MAPKISQLPGVGLVSISGGQTGGAHRGEPDCPGIERLTMEDLRTTIVAANVNQAKGNSMARISLTRSARMINCSRAAITPRW